MNAGMIGNTVKTVLETQGHEVDRLAVTRIRGTKSFWVSGDAYKNGEKHYVTGTVDPEDFAFNRDIKVEAVSQVDVKALFRGL